MTKHYNNELRPCIWRVYSLLSKLINIHRKFLCSPSNQCRSRTTGNSCDKEYYKSWIYYNNETSTKLAASLSKNKANKTLISIKHLSINSQSVTAITSTQNKVSDSKIRENRRLIRCQTGCQCESPCFKLETLEEGKQVRPKSKQCHLPLSIYCLHNIEYIYWWKTVVTPFASWQLNNLK